MRCTGAASHDCGSPTGVRRRGQRHSCLAWRRQPGYDPSLRRDHRPDEGTGAGCVRTPCECWGGAPAKMYLARRRVDASVAALSVNVMCPWTRAPPAKSARWEAAATSSGKTHNPDDVPRNIIRNQELATSVIELERAHVRRDPVGQRVARGSARPARAAPPQVADQWKLRNPEVGAAPVAAHVVEPALPFLRSSAQVFTHPP